MNIFRYEKYSHTATLLFRYFISCVLDEDDVSSFLVSTFIFNSYSINFFYSHKNVLRNQRSQVVDVIFSIHLLHILCNVIDLCKCILSLERVFSCCLCIQFVVISSVLWQCLLKISRVKISVVFRSITSIIPVVILLKRHNLKQMDIILDIALCKQLKMHFTELAKNWVHFLFVGPNM